MCVWRGNTLTCFVEWNKTEVLQFAEIMYVQEDVGKLNICIMTNVTLSVFLITKKDEFIK